MGILQARILEWIAMPSSRGSSQPRDGIELGSPALQTDSLPAELPGKPVLLNLHIFLPDLLVLPAPKTTCRALVLTWTLGLGTPGWGHRFRKGDAKLLTTCPPPVPALGLTSLKRGREGEPGGRLTCPPGQPSSQLLAPRLAQPGALVRLGVGADCRLQPISVPLPGGAPAGVAGHRVRSPALSRNLSRCQGRDKLYSPEGEDLESS